MQNRFYFAIVALCYACVATGHESIKSTKVDDGDTEGPHHSLAQTVEALKTEMAVMKSEIQELRKLHSESNSAVGFTAWLTSDTTINAGERVIFDGVLTNIGNHYNSDTGTFIVPVTGDYMFALQAHSMYDKHMRASIFNSGNVLLSVSADTDGDTSGSSTTVAIAQCNAGDVIYVEGLRDGDEMHGGFTDKYSSFSGYLLTVIA